VLVRGFTSPANPLRKITIAAYGLQHEMGLETKKFALKIIEEK
jgi:hypothetical protein